MAGGCLPLDRVADFERCPDGAEVSMETGPVLRAWGSILAGGRPKSFD